MWKKLLIGPVIASVLALPAVSSLAQQPLRVWHAMSADAGAVLVAAAGEFEAGSGTAVEVRAIQSELLFQTVASAVKSGDLPDVIVSGDTAAAALVDNNLMQPPPGRGTFYLEDLLDALPGLLGDRCGSGPIGPCLWPNASSSLPITTPDARVIQRTLDWLCETPDRLPFCKGGTLPGTPVSWGFTLYLLNSSWLAEQGIDTPLGVDGVLALRAEYGLAYRDVKLNALPAVSALPANAIVTVSSDVLVADPAASLQLLGNLFDAGYKAVIGIETDSVYVLAGAQNTAQAEAFAQFMAANTSSQADLLTQARRLPAFSAAELTKWGVKSDEAGALLGGLVLLVTYAQLAY